MQVTNTTRTILMFIALLILGKCILSVIHTVIEIDTTKNIPDAIILSTCILICLLHIKGKSKKLSICILLGFFTTLVITLLSAYANDGNHISAIKTSSTIFSPLLLFAALVSITQDYTPPLISISKKLLIATSLIIITASFTLPTSQNRLIERLPVIFENLHTTAYMVLSLAFLSISLLLCRRRENNPKILNLTQPIYLLIFLATSLILTFGWGVRTTMFSLLVFILTIFIKNLNNLLIKNTLFSLTLAALTLLFLAPLLISTDAAWIDDLGSGRISMYITKMELIASRDILTFLIGSGPDSDLVQNSRWWWEAKGSHNDYITILFEYGAFLFILLVQFFILFIKYLEGKYSQALMLSYLSTSLISNGYIDRPLPAYFLALALYNLYIVEKNAKETS